MNAPLPRFNALAAMSDIEQTGKSTTNPTLATLETLAPIPCGISSLRDRILQFTNEDWCEIEERSAIIQHDGGMACFEAEALAIAEILAKR